MLFLAPRSLLAPALALSALVASPLAAQEAEVGLGCMEDSYSAEQRGQIADLGLQASIADGGNLQADALAQIAVGMAFECAATNDWDESQTQMAAFFELGRVMEESLRASGYLTSDQLADLDSALATGDRTDLWQTVERVMVAGLLGQEVQMTTRDLLVLGNFAEELSVTPDEGFDEKIGVLLGFMALQDFASRTFAPLAN